MTIVSYFLQLSLLLLFTSAVHPVANADDDDNDEYANGNGRNGSVNGVWIDSVIVVAVSIFDFAVAVPFGAIPVLIAALSYAILIYAVLIIAHMYYQSMIIIIYLKSRLPKLRNDLNTGIKLMPY